MANKFYQTSDGKAPTFFIPASYKGHQISKPTVVPASSAPLHNNHITSPTKRIEPGRSTDTNDPAVSGHVTINPTTHNSACGDPNQSSYLLPSPSGVLDLSLYNFVPAQTKPAAKANGKPTKSLIEEQQSAEIKELIDNEVAVIAKEKKRRRFRRPRRNSKLDRLIRLLEDKRVGDDGENAGELEDLQMPRLRKVLNIIFVTLGVCFLLAVIIVIMYTTIATESDTLIDVCLHRTKPTEGCENQTVTGSEEVLSDPNSPSTALSSANSPLTPGPSPRSTTATSATVQPGAQSFPDMPAPPLPSLHNPPDVSISGYQTAVTGQDTPDALHEAFNNYYPEPNRYEPIYSTSERNRPPYSWSNQRYSVDLNSGSIQEQPDTRNQWWPVSYPEQP